jgi:hypothetical protein
MERDPRACLWDVQLEALLAEALAPAEPVVLDRAGLSGGSARA